MRAAWITTGFASAEEHDGAAAIHELAREIASHDDIELTIFSLYHPVNEPQYKYHGAKVFSFARTKTISKLEKLKIWRRCIKRFSEEHRTKRFDLIHSMWAGESGYVASRLSRKYSIPLAVNICGGELAYFPEIKYGSRTKFWQKKFVDRSFRQAKAVISGSDCITGLLKKYYSCEIYKKIAKIPFGVDEGKFYPGIVVKKPGDTIKLINIANVSTVKDHLTMLKALLKVREKFPDIALLHYGKDEDNVLQKMVDSLGLEKNVHLNGFIEYDKVPGILRGADIFVLSSLYESQNMSVIEAAFCGIPVVSTDAGAAKEITGNIVQPCDSNALAEMLIRTVENLVDEKRKALARIEKLKADYSLKVSAQRFIELYRSLTANT